MFVRHDPAVSKGQRSGPVRRLLESKLIRRMSFADYRRQIRDHYDGGAGSLLATASLLSLHSPLAGRLLRRRRFDLRGCRRILDVGAGAGQILRHLICYGDADTQLYASDLSVQMLRRARQRIARPSWEHQNNCPLPARDGMTPQRRPTFIAADITRLPFADASFDCVTCGWVIEHLPDPRPGLSEISRVLEPEGRLLLFATEDTLTGALCSRTWKCRTYNRHELRDICIETKLPWKTELWFSVLHRLLGLGGILVEAQKQE